MMSAVLVLSLRYSSEGRAVSVVKALGRMECMGLGWWLRVEVGKDGAL